MSDGVALMACYGAMEVVKLRVEKIKSQAAEVRIY